jgi:unsaturated rhamnogalacturonyl hydrolase
LPGPLVLERRHLHGPARLDRPDQGDQGPRYLVHADSEFWATTDLLYDKTEHLYFRDSRFIAKRSDAGAKIFWGRGNGWAFAGIARILQDLPKDHPSRPRYEALFKEMAAKIVTLQGEQGYWPVSLLEPQKTPETSGTGFFVYGLAWGVNHGLLPPTSIVRRSTRAGPPWPPRSSRTASWAGCSG